jgi:hypothetical protein
MKWFTHPDRFVDWLANAALSLLIGCGAWLTETRPGMSLAFLLAGMNIVSFFRLMLTKEEFGDE